MTCTGVKAALAGNWNMERKIEVLNKIKDAEEKAKVIVHEAVSKREKILKEAAERAQDFEKREVEDAVSRNQKAIIEASRIGDVQKVDQRRISRLREAAGKKSDSAAKLVWKEFEARFR